MNPEIVSLIKEKGILLDKKLFDLLDRFPDVSSARIFLDGLLQISGDKMISSSTLINNVAYAERVVNAVPGEMRQLVEETFITLGISFSIQQTRSYQPVQEKKQSSEYKVFYADSKVTKKVELADFVGHFRSRYQQIQRMLMGRPELQNLVSIGKLGPNRQNLSIIGIVSEKRTTPNKNLILRLEDLTGSISVLIKSTSELFKTANELQLDDVVGIKGSGSREFLYAQDIIFPDSFKEKTYFEEDMCVAFVSDIHVGSHKHLGSQFERFLDWISGDDPLAHKIKYIFFVGDNVDGVGVFPGQERLLALKSLHDQYKQLASYLSRIPSRISLFMCPGQHDSVRVAEPQPVIDSYYGKALYDIQNLTLVSNPSVITLLEGGKEFSVLMYHGASIHAFINEIEELRLLKAHRCPAKAVRHMLKRRHLAPSHGVSPSIVYVPNASYDPLVIASPPDVLCTGEVHRLDIDSYNGTLIITGSCWQGQTEFEEKVGNVPDPCKVPVLNLKTRELKILDFNDG